MGLELGQAGLDTPSLVEVVIRVSDNKRAIVRRLFESLWSGVLCPEVRMCLDQCWGVSLVAKLSYCLCS